MKSKIHYTLDMGIKPFMINTFYALYLLSVRVVSYHGNIGDLNLFVDLLLFISLTKDCLIVFFLSTLSKGFKMVNKHTNYLLDRDVISSAEDSALNGSTPKFCRSLYKSLS